ncbi:hypothetical protein SAMN04489727_8664 [Amycolatopsis tolypomycina]|uniref:Uncharacterized protein n=1 Tax=Amycolatopsis tolypomycina TaxID=208445 RepID=A0A1H5C909_9PSEU|nr:hypothetical protein SAMN04489727_8664 [Amycolatopsis tolypomycina]
MGVRLQVVPTQGKDHREAPVRRWATTCARVVRRLQTPAFGGHPGKSTA